MTTPPLDPTRPRVLWFSLGFSVLFFGTYFALFGDVGLYPGDEGYLWYGVVRTLAGEVPLRDFQSYEPGRYYWCAALAHLFGPGLLGLRASAMAFGAMGLTFALLVASRFTRSLVELALCGALIGLWMFPTFKLFEPALGCMATWFAVRLLERPSPGRHLAAGLYVGLAGFVGRNHALYAGVALGSLALLRLWRERPEGGGRAMRLYVLGAVAGHAPMWFLFLFVPGFTAGFIDSCRIFIAHGSQPLPYPWRWPWTVEWSELAGWNLAVEGALTLVFLLPCIVLPYGVLRTLRFSAEELRRHAAFAAASFVGALYIHHASVRSHPQHLAQCLAPVLLLTMGCVLGLHGWRRPALGAALALVLLLALPAAHPVLSRYHPGERELVELELGGGTLRVAPSERARELVELEVAGETLRVPSSQAPSMEALVRTVKELVPADEPLFIAGTSPMLYPLLGKASPVSWIAFYFHANPAEQAELIAHLKERHVDWVLVESPTFMRLAREKKANARPAFSSTHPLVWESFEREFDRHEVPGAPFALLHRRK